MTKAIDDKDVESIIAAMPEADRDEARQIFTEHPEARSFVERRPVVLLRPERLLYVLNTAVKLNQAEQERERLIDPRRSMHIAN